MMKLFGRRSIGRRVFFTVFVACAFAWIAIYLLGLYLVNKSDSGNFDREMLTLADTVKNIAEQYPDAAQMSVALAGLEASINSQARLLRIPVEFQNFHIRSADGALVARSRSALDKHLGGLDQVGFFDANHGSKAYRVHAAWAVGRKYRIELTQSIASRQDAFNYVMMSREGLLLPLLVGFPVLLIPIWLAVRFSLRPVRRLSNELASRPAGDLEPLDSPSVDAELMPLVGELNGTFAKLRGLLQREREFLADAAHELRTPLALIAAQADNLSLSKESAFRDAAIQRLNVGVARCSHLVNQLLDLARLEAKADGQVSNVDIADIVRETLATHALEANARGINVNYDGPDQCIATLPRHALESVLNNLVSNAVRYGNLGGRVVVFLALEDRSALKLSVSDDGPGIPADARAEIFVRFKRGNNLTAGGSGLGLAIAASAARQFGARIVLRDGLDGRGITFSVEWPSSISPILH